MNNFLIFNLQITVYGAVAGLLLAWFVWPKLRAMDQQTALAVPLLLSSLRVSGLFFLVPALNVNMPPEFATAAAYGDASVAILALVGAVANRAKSPLGVPLAWAYAILGGGDLVYGFVQGFRYDMFAHLGGSWGPVIATASVIIPSLVALFTLLLSPNPATARAGHGASMGSLATGKP